MWLSYYIDKSVLLENTPLVKFIRNHIRDSGGVFSISSLVKILMISLISNLSRKLYLNSLVYHWNIFRSSSKVFGNIWLSLESFEKCLARFLWPLDKFWSIFGNLRKVVRNLRKIIKNAIISMSIQGSWKDPCPTKTLSWSDETNCGWTSPKKVGRFLCSLTVKCFTIKALSGHHVRPQLGFRWTWANFGLLVCDDRLLFAALLCNKKNITHQLEDMNFMFLWQEQYLTCSLCSLVIYCSCHSKAVAWGNF